MSFTLYFPLAGIDNVVNKVMIANIQFSKEMFVAKAIFAS